MNIQTSFEPNWVSAPGKTIKDILNDRNIALTEFAKGIDQNMDYVNNLLDGEEKITSSIANQLQNLLGTPASFWINRENIFRHQVKAISSRDKQAWLNSLPIKDMVKLGWIKKSSDYYQECLRFFSVPDVSSWNEQYLQLTQNVRFRTSEAFDSKIGSVVSWLRFGEIQSQVIKCAPWNSEMLFNRLDQIKELTRIKEPSEFLPDLTRICSDCGIAVIVSPTPSGCPASGAVKFVNEEKAMMLLSFRYLSDDHFWFTFFHEIGHLLMDHGRKIFIEGINQTSEDEDEKEANLFAGEALIPSPLRQELRVLKRNKHSIVRFAMKAGVSPGIVVGQMQHEGIIPSSYLNGYKRRYNWEEIKSSLEPIL